MAGRPRSRTGTDLLEVMGRRKEANLEVIRKDLNAIRRSRELRPVKYRYIYNLLDKAEALGLVEKAGLEARVPGGHGYGIHAFDGYVRVYRLNEEAIPSPLWSRLPELVAGRPTRISRK